MKDESKDNKNAFITRVKIKKIKNDESKESIKATNIDLKPRKRVLNYLSDKNKNIIKHDQNIFVDCLYSEVISNIDKNKIIYNPMGNMKTNFAITKEHSYKKIKQFETIIDNIIKIPKDVTTNENKINH